MRKIRLISKFTTSQFDIHAYIILFFKDHAENEALVPDTSERLNSELFLFLKKVL